MSVSTLFHLALGLLALVGIAAVTLVLMLASPVRPPPPLASIHEGAMRMDTGGAPDLSRFQARDGTWLAYRLYPATNGAKGRIALLAHGSSASSIEMHGLATALAGAGVTSLPAIAFANVPEAKMLVTSQYSFRLMQSYTAPPDWKGAFDHAKGRVAVVGGADDELMDAEAYRRVLPPLGVPVTIVPGVDHMGIVYRPEAIKAILAAMSEIGA
jgi:pimeloyl-ACP methyl ester carboxylesterase